MPLDFAILKFINVTIANPALDFLFGYIGNFRLWALPIAIIIFLLLWKGGPRGRWLVLLSVITVLVVDGSIHYIWKRLFARLRPCHAEPAITWLRLFQGCGGKYGLPSSHAANLFSQAVIIGAFYKSSRYYMYPLAILISLSRVYLGVHYPSDILAGAFYGAMIGILILYIAKVAAAEKIILEYSFLNKPDSLPQFNIDKPK
ncbi:MAG TPA: phosphatase PAP2 family protein [candidate division Zixibacteria bacterium]|nr:phosphatase PAP2 family protein [candidate division Zixibacteria bacterium]